MAASTDELIYVICLIFLGICIVTFNLIFIITITTDHRFQKVANFYLVSLSCADLLVGVFVITMLNLSILHVHTPQIWCTISPILELFSFSAGIFTIVMMSHDRYRAVMCPVRYNPSVKSILIALAITWLCAFIYSLRILLQFEITKMLKNKDISDHIEKFNHTIIGDDDFCNVLYEEDNYDVIFRGVDFILLFILPIITVSIMYFRIIKVLWVVKTTSSISTQRKRSLVKMLILTIVMFFICWMPFYMYDIIDDLMELSKESEMDNIDMKKDRNTENGLVQLRWFLILFALGHSIIHPILYAVFNVNFRQAIWVKVEKCLCL